jgi:hypothetical protein
MHTPRAIVASSAFALVVLVGNAWPQTSRPPRPTAPLPPSNAVETAPIGGVTARLSPRAPSGIFYDQGAAGGGVWVRGDDFKAHFTSAGATYIPFFGSRAPRDFELHLALQQVTVDGLPIELTGGASPERAQDRIRIDRGAVDEVYELTPRSLEQEFVVESLPAAGDVVLRASIGTELARSTSADGFEFSNEFGSVRCSRATAIDARGRSLALETDLDAGGLTIRVPASFVADAAMPIVVDPVWSSIAIEGGNAVALSPDIAFATGNYLFVCWEWVYSASDHDLYGELIDPNGSVYSGFYLDYSSTNWARPRCAHLTAGDRVLVVAEVGPSGARSVWCRAVQVGQPTAPVVTNPVEISEPTAQGEKFHAEVGGDPFPYTPSYFCVVYERGFAANDHDILARLVDGDGNLASSTINLENTFGTLDTAPAISNTDDTTVWNIAWQREVAPGNNDIFGARVAWSGGIFAPTFPLPAHAENELNPTVSGPIQGTNRYMVAWQRPLLHYGSTPDFDIDACLVDGATPLTDALLPWAQSGEDDIRPDLDSNGSHFVCAYSTLFVGSYRIVFAEIEPVGNTFIVRESPLAQYGFTDLDVHVVNHEDSDPANLSTTYYAIYQHDGVDIAMSTYVGYEGGPFESVCNQNDVWASCPCGAGYSGGGCPNSVNGDGAVLSGNGLASTTHDTLTLQFANLPPNTSTLLFQSTANNQSVLGDGVRCLASPILRFPLRAANGSGATGYGSQYGDTPISVRGGVPALGGVYYYQVWYRDSGAFCTPATTNLSNALRVYWTP